MNDVTVSTWNKFWSFSLISGLRRGGFSVRALGTTRNAPDADSYECCWPSAIATQLGYRLPGLRDNFFGWAIPRYEKFAAARTDDTRCFWGWSNCHLGAFEQARKRGIPVILETGSTHSAWARRVLAAEYLERGMTLERSLFDRLVPTMLAEYEIADRICVPSNFVARTFVEEGVPAEKLHVNAYGADIEFWSECRRDFQPEKKPFVVVYTAQIMLRKGIAYLLDAWKELDASGAELWLIGGVHPDCAELVKVLPAGVRLVGPKSHAELRELYASADAYVLPSQEEGLARSVLEAMASGLPVIVTEETGATDVMVDGEDGWVVRSRDPEMLASAFSSALSDPEATFARGRSARKRVEPYSWTAYGDRAAEFLRGVLG